MPAKLVIGVLTRHTRRISPLVQQMEANFGPVDLVSQWYAFRWTRYYEAEMGPGLKRRMLAFAPLIDQERLPEIKEQTNALEHAHKKGQNRRFNIDPGYLLPERFVLATGKNYTHRIYIGRLVYADLTLLYQKGGFVPLAWTYPDYAHEDITGFLTKVRHKYMRDLKTNGHL